MRPDYPSPVEGTKAVVLTPALVKDGEAAYLKKTDVARLGLDLESVRRVARASASVEAKKLKPEYVRDARGVLQYAVITTDSPTTAGAVLAPEFAALFADTLGPDLLVAIPNRYRVYVYPALAGDFASTAGLVLRDYELSPFPVSREVFRLTPRGLRAMGAFEP